VERRVICKAEVKNKNKGTEKNWGYLTKAQGNKNLNPKVNFTVSKAATAFHKIQAFKKQPS
jgi:hypothetical protein